MGLLIFLLFLRKMKREEEECMNLDVVLFIVTDRLDRYLVSFFAKVCCFWWWYEWFFHRWPLQRQSRLLDSWALHLFAEAWSITDVQGSIFKDTFFLSGENDVNRMRMKIWRSRENKRRNSWRRTATSEREWLMVPSSHCGGKWFCGSVRHMGL